MDVEHGGLRLAGKTHSFTNMFKKEFYHKWASNLREKEKEQHTPGPPKGDYHSPSSDDSLSPCRNKQRNEENLQGEFKKNVNPNL